METEKKYVLMEIILEGREGVRSRIQYGIQDKTWIFIISQNELPTKYHNHHQQECKIDFEQTNLG